MSLLKHFTVKEEQRLTAVGHLCLALELASAVQGTLSYL